MVTRRTNESDTPDGEGDLATAICHHCAKPLFHEDDQVLVRDDALIRYDEPAREMPPSGGAVQQLFARLSERCSELGLALKHFLDLGYLVRLLLGKRPGLPLSAAYHCEDCQKTFHPRGEITENASASSRAVTE